MGFLSDLFKDSEEQKKERLALEARTVNGYLRKIEPLQRKLDDILYVSEPELRKRYYIGTMGEALRRRSYVKMDLHQKLCHERSRAMEKVALAQSFDEYFKRRVIPNSIMGHKQLLDDIASLNYNIHYYIGTDKTKAVYMAPVTEKMRELVGTPSGHMEEATKRHGSLLNLEAQLKEEAKRFDEYLVKNIWGFPPTMMMLGDGSYGKCDQALLDKVATHKPESIKTYVGQCGYTFDQNSEIDLLEKISMKLLMECIWAMAVTKPFNAELFSVATKTFNSVYCNDHVDVMLAELYAKMQVGGENAVMTVVSEYLREKKDKPKPDGLFLKNLASGLMWMGAYRCEQKVLEYILQNGYEMPAKLQERLHALATGGGKTLDVHDVRSSDSELYFDVSALSWKDDDYASLFENLSFQDKQLSYSLAVRDEDKTLSVLNGMGRLKREQLWTKLKREFENGYGDDVRVKMVSAVAISGTGQEELGSILVVAEDCPYMGILLYITQIGKKMMIKFYTLYMPDDKALSLQKNQALSLQKKLSPKFVSWEDSMKEDILRVLEQMLNNAVQAEPVKPVEPVETIKPVEPKITDDIWF